MSKKTLISIIIFLFILALGGWYFIAQKSGPGDPGRPSAEGVSKGGFFGNFFPFGNGVDDQDETQDGIIPPTEQTFDREDLIGSVNTPLRLQQLTSKAIAGATSLSLNQDGSLVPVARFIERSTGNVYEINPNTLSRTRITNTTIPAINEVLWSDDGENLVIRYLNENNVIKTFIGNIVETVSSTSTEGISSSSISKINGSFIKDDITNIVNSPTKQSFAHLSTDRSGTKAVQVGFNNNILGTLFETPYSEWIITWPKIETITATTKATGRNVGYLYFINTSSGVFSKIMGGVQGLTTSVSPDTKNVLYSESLEGIFTLKNLSTDTNERRAFSLRTLPEKCVWSQIRSGVVLCGVPKKVTKGLYPDDWYKGVVSFSDEIWEIDVVRNIVRILAAPQDIVRTNIDVINPFISEDEKYLFFTNKKDNTLWSLTLEEELS